MRVDVTAHFYEMLWCDRMSADEMNTQTHIEQGFVAVKNRSTKSSTATPNEVRRKSVKRVGNTCMQRRTLEIYVPVTRTATVGHSPIRTGPKCVQEQ